MCPCGNPDADAIHDPWVAGSHQAGHPPIREDAHADTTDGN